MTVVLFFVFFVLIKFVQTLGVIVKSGEAVPLTRGNRVRPISKGMGLSNLLVRETRVTVQLTLLLQLRTKYFLVVDAGKRCRPLN